MVDDQVQFGFGQNVDERGQHLEGAFAAAKDDQIVANEVLRVRECGRNGVNEVPELLL